MRRSLEFLTLLILLATAPFVGADPGRPGGLPDGVDPGELKVLTMDGKEPTETQQLPLRHTDVQIRVSGFVAHTTVTQRYGNPFEAPIEAVYVFPLPNKAAVDGMTMKVGDKVIRGLIKRRDEARKIYEDAKAAGKRTGLLEQERPNIFTQSVGNILPGDNIEIEISYVDILDYRDEGAFELVFPMVVGPRYIPGDAADRQTARRGSGIAPDSDQEPDASRITPPVLKPGERSGHDIALEVDLDAAIAIRGLHSISHAVDIDEASPSRRKVRLHPSDTIPNKDFVLRYEVAGKAPEAAVITHHADEQGGFFTLIVLPQQQVRDAATVPRDLIFILDTSGSMRGLPLDQSKQAMERLIAGMRPDDRFNLVRFAGDTGTLWPEPRPNTPANVQAAKQFVQSQRGSGGTEMRRGIVEALAQPSNPDRLRIAFLLTDGYVGNEEGILQAIEKERRGARIFTLGVGSSVNRYLLDRAATVGRGDAFYLRQDEDAGATIERFFKRVDRPNLAHVEIDWNGLAVTDLTPARVPDLWQGQPIMLHGRYRQAGEAQVEVRGRLGNETYELAVPVSLPASQPENAVLASVWARARVRELMLEMVRGADAKPLERQITGLGLEYRIMTQWTSFVAVEEKVVNQGGELTTVVQPVELPDGVDYEGIFGDADAVLPTPPMARAMRAPGRAMRSRPRTGFSTSADSNSGAGVLGYASPRRLPQPAEPTKPEAPATARCQRSTMSVSGGLKYATVDQRLRGAWDALCRALKDKVGGKTLVQVWLAVAADGTVSKVELEAEESLPKELVEALRRWFLALSFGPVAQPGTARVELELVLQ